MRNFLQQVTACNGAYRHNSKRYLGGKSSFPRVRAVQFVGGSVVYGVRAVVDGNTRGRALQTCLACIGTQTGRLDNASFKINGKSKGAQALRINCLCSFSVIFSLPQGKAQASAVRRKLVLYLAVKKI